MTIGIEHVNDYLLIRFEIRFERKLPIRRSLILCVGLLCTSVLCGVPCGLRGWKN